MPLIPHLRACSRVCAFATWLTRAKRRIAVISWAYLNADTVGGPFASASGCILGQTEHAVTNGIVQGSVTLNRARPDEDVAGCGGGQGVP
eukprot:438782-Rhodomonas_salina.1